MSAAGCSFQLRRLKLPQCRCPPHRSLNHVEAPNSATNRAESGKDPSIGNGSLLIPRHNVGYAFEDAEVCENVVVVEMSSGVGKEGREMRFGDDDEGWTWLRAEQRSPHPDLNSAGLVQ